MFCKDLATDGAEVDWVGTLRTLDILRGHCGQLCDTNKSITKEGLEKKSYHVEDLFFSYI